MTQRVEFYAGAATPSGTKKTPDEVAGEITEFFDAFERVAEHLIALQGPAPKEGETARSAQSESPPTDPAVAKGSEPEQTHPPRVADPPATPMPPRLNKHDQEGPELRDTVQHAFAAIDRLASHLDEWRGVAVAVREAAEAATAVDAAKAVKDPVLLQEIHVATDLAGRLRPGVEAYRLMGDQAEGVVALLGVHVADLQSQLLAIDACWPGPQALEPPSPWWTEECEQLNAWRKDAAAVWDEDIVRTRRAAVNLCSAIERATQHVAVLSLWRAVNNAAVGDRVSVSDELAHWELSETAAAEVKRWVGHDPKAPFEGWEPTGLRRGAPREIRAIVDLEQDSIYRTPERLWRRLWYSALVAVMPVAAFVLLVLVLEVLFLAKVLKDPESPLRSPNAFWALMALNLFVLIGALLHIASRSISGIKFEDPIRVYATAKWLDWVVLRWVGILKLFIPITAVTGTMWITGKAPTDPETLGAAIIAGYAADSLFRTSFQQVQAKAEASATPKTSPAAPAAPVG